MSPSDALRLLYACSLRVDGGIWSDGIPLLRAKQYGVGYRVWFPCVAVSTLHQDCPWAHPMERGGCDCGNFIVSFAGVTTSKSESGTSVGRCRGLRLADIGDIDVEV